MTGIWLTEIILESRLFFQGGESYIPTSHHEKGELIILIVRVLLEHIPKDGHECNGENPPQKISKKRYSIWKPGAGGGSS